MNNLTVDDFKYLFGMAEDEAFEMPTIKLINEMNWNYRIANNQEKDEIVDKIFKRIFEHDFSKAIDHNSDRWVKGWGENLDEFKKNKDIKSLTPKYIRPGQPLRLNGKFIFPDDPNFELNWYFVFRDWFARKYLKNFDSIYEFGCGSGHNIKYLSSIFPEKNFYGFDWVQPSVDILNEMSQDNDLHIKGDIFDFFNPNYDLSFDNNSAVITMGALEQTGSEYSEFIDFLLVKKPDSIFHVEPFFEFYEKDNVVDYTAVRSHKVKNFWIGLPDYLKKIDKDNSITVEKKHRVKFGSLILEGYSQLFWKP